MSKIRRLMGLAVLLFFCFSLPAPSAYAFPDVKENHWAKRYIDYLVARGIAGGYGDGTFRPERGVTRGEFAALLIQAMNLQDSVWALEGNPQLFRDVKANHWAEGYIQLAWELGIVSGYADSTYRPDQTIRRDEMVSMLVRALRYSGQGNKVVTFSDAHTIADWVKESVDLAASWGLVSGFADGSFRPAATVTRAQAAVFISNFLEQRGARFDYYAELQQVNTAARELTAVLNDDAEKLKYTADTKIYRGGKEISAGELAAAVPCSGFLVLNSAGQVSYLEIVEQSLPGDVSLSLGAQAQQISAALSREGGQAGLLERELELEPGPAQASEFRAGRSLEITREVLGVNKLAEDMKVDGSGQLIAVIDSGLDPLHPDLLTTSAGKEKLVDFIDLTEEGKVATSGTISAKNIVTIEGVTYVLGNIGSQSGVYRYGFFAEEALDMDLNFNGTKTDRFLVLLADRVTGGKYDTVYVDTNYNASLIDEKPMAVYSKSHDRAGFSSTMTGSRFNFVLSDIAADGSFVKLGFDVNGHGTQVAGVAAANGSMQGVAPGARLLAIKVLNRQGETSWEMLDKAIRTAVDKGATIVNLSMGYYQDETSGNNSLTYLLDTLSKQKKVVFTVAAGNKGPGIGTLATPGNAKGAIGVGAYIAPAMWKNDYGWDVDKESLWYFSSAGPRQDGLVAPTVVAPGSAVTAFPLWSGSAYRLAEGTSIAAPHLAGAVALLLDSARKAGVTATPLLVKKAVMLGARQLPQFSAAEAGYGVADISEAWRQLRRLEPQTPLKSYTWNRSLGIGEGIYAREFLPGQVPYRVGNLGQEDEIVFWKTTADWLRPWFKMTSLPHGMQRDIPVDYVLPPEPGIYTGFLEGQFLDSTGPEVAMLTTVIKPYILDKDNSYRMEEAESLGAAQYKRYFFRVPPGTEGLQAVLTVPGGVDGYQGRVRMHVVRPNGQEYMMTDFAGRAQENSSGKEWVGATVDSPEAGTWEVVVYSSPSLSGIGLKESQYRLRVQLSGVPEQADGAVTSQYLIGLVPKKLEPNQPNYLSLSIRDRQRKTPVDDMMIEINGQIYQVKKGWVTFTVVPTGDKLKLDVRL